MSTKRTYPGQVERICSVCSTIFFTWPSEIKRGGGQRCSQICYKADTTPAAERFWKHVQKTDSCWLWTGAKRHWGYGVIGISLGVFRAAHRFSWEIHFGPIPDGMKVLHRCDNPPCVNPEHLFLGTLKDNSQDMVTKDRAFFRKGSKNIVAKLTEAQVIEIRRRYEVGDITQKQLRAEYGIAHSPLFKLLHRQTWKHC